MLARSMTQVVELNVGKTFIGSDQGGRDEERANQKDREGRAVSRCIGGATGLRAERVRTCAEEE